MKDLSNVDSFGGIDAAADQLLDQCFEDHEAYVRARDHQRYLVIGRKGSGKTAIFRKFLRAHTNTSFSFGHTFADYPWHHHDRQKTVGVPEEHRYLNSWEYLILITLAKILLNHDHTQPCTDAAMQRLGTLERFIIDSYGSRDPDVSQIFMPTTQLKISPHFSINTGLLKAGVSAERLPMEELPIVVQEVNINLTSAVVDSLNPELDYYVCFDELDLGFSKTDKDYELRLIGLLLAARKINLRAREKGKNLSTLIFLRDDIFNGLQFEDKDKLTENAVSRIEWDTSRTQHTLKELMEKRFATVLEIPENGAWEQVFDETEEMRGRQKKYQHILDRTFLRPRDVIKFCNEVLAAYKRQDPAKLQRFKNRDINEARNEYSDYLLREIDDEIHKHVPNYEAYIDILKTLDSMQFTYKDFEKTCTDRAAILQKDYDPKHILGQLFEFSLIGFYQRGGAGYGGSRYIWRYKDPRAQFNENASEFRIHYGFKEVLGLKQYKKAGQ